MAPMMFVNLPVADPVRTRRFFTRIGFEFDELFCDAGSLCMRVNAQTMVVMHTHGRFAGYAAARTADTAAGRETVLALSAASRAEVDRRADDALAAGAAPLRAAEDLGFCYCRSFCDPDGHAWEIVWMNPAAIAADGDGPATDVSTDHRHDPRFDANGEHP